MLSFFKKLFQSKDELVGNWLTDSSGGFLIVMGSSINFNANGTGSFKSWASGDEEDGGYNYEGNFKWERVNNTQIKIKENQKEEIITYIIKPYKNPYGKKGKQVTSPTKKVGKTEVSGFWNFAQDIYKLD